MKRLKAWWRERVHSFTINDNERREGNTVRTGSIWRSGRWCFYYGHRPMKKREPHHEQEYEHSHEFRFEWSVLKVAHSAALGIQFGGGDGMNEIQIRIGIPFLCSLYFGHTVSRRFLKWILPWHTYEGRSGGGWTLARELEVSAHNWRVWAHLWVHPMDQDYGDYGKTKIPGWRRFSFSVNPLGLLGRVRCECTEVEPERAVLIQMPEGEYCALLKIERMTWTRKLWPWWPLSRERVYRNIQCPNGIPFSGKGENSWDCGEDGIFGSGFEVRTDEEACALFAASALETRRERNDPRVWPESPRDRDERFATLRADRKAEELALKSGGASPDQET